MPQSTTSAGRVDAAERRSETSQMKHLHAQPVPCVSVRAFLVWRRARAVTAVPVPSRARPLALHALRRYLNAGACSHDSACVRVRTRTASACTARLICGDGSVACTCAFREHAACLRRYFACATDSAGVQMNERAQSSCAARIRTAVVRACIANCWQKVHNLVEFRTWPLGIVAIV